MISRNGRMNARDRRRPYVVATHTPLQTAARPGTRVTVTGSPRAAAEARGCERDGIDVVDQGALRHGRPAAQRTRQHGDQDAAANANAAARATTVRQRILDVSFAPASAPLSASVWGCCR